jgi:ribosome-associated toxin RatA of RatAB toxin-antitoxin module
MGRIEASASADINAPLASVFAVASNVERVQEWQPGLLAAVILDRDGLGQARLVRVKTSHGEATLRFTYRESNSIMWFQEEGDAAHFSGSWRFSSTAAGITRATYEVELDFGRTLGLLVAGPIKSKLRERIVDAMPLRLKHQVERLALDAGESDAVEPAA